MKGCTSYRGGERISELHVDSANRRTESVGQSRQLRYFVYIFRNTYFKLFSALIDFKCCYLTCRPPVFHCLQVPPAAIHLQSTECLTSAFRAAPPEPPPLFFLISLAPPSPSSNLRLLDPGSARQGKARQGRAAPVGALAARPSPGDPGSAVLPEELTWKRNPSFETPYEVQKQAVMEGSLQTSIHMCHENGQWMSQLPEKLWDIPLYNLALPGSHDTMTYCLDKNSAVSGNECKLVKFLSKCIPCIVHPVIMKWSTTQVLTVTEQLEAGVRYLDFRIAHKPNDPSVNLYFVHMVYTTVTVQDILWEVLRWLETHPQEIVILACRNFDGLNTKLHCRLIAWIKEIFQCKLCPRNVVPTLRTMWQHGHQVIVSYEEDVAVEEHCELWPAIPYWWGNKTATRSLIRFLERMKRMGRPEKFFVAGINLTENLRYILQHPFGSLKKMTLQSLPCLKIWIKQQYPGPQKECINIIAGDFIGNDDFVKDVIELNTKINPSLPCQRKGAGTSSI